MTVVSEANDPRTVVEAMRRLDENLWIKAMEEEHKSVLDSEW